MKGTEFHPIDYDGHGRLYLSFLSWYVLLSQVCTWVLFVTVNSSREQGNILLNLFCPDYDAFWLGLPSGVPAVLTFLFSRRYSVFPVLWHWLHGLLILVRLIPLCWQPVMWLAGDPLNGVELALLMADIVTLIWLLTNQRLRACFSLEKG